MGKKEETKVEEQEYVGVKLTLHNTLWSEEELSLTPSMKDGYTAEEEACFRHRGCELIQIARIVLQLPDLAEACAQGLLQRFFCVKSLKKNKINEVAMACIWVASKIEEDPRRLRDVINTFDFIKQKQNDPNCKETMMELDDDYKDLKQRVVKLERRVLKELGFCVSVVHPHKFIILYLQVLGMKKNKVLTQLAQNYMSDCMRTNVLVKYTPQAVACGCICYSTRLLGVEVPTGNPYWSTLFDVSFETLECVMRDISMTYLLTPIVKKMCKEETAKAKQLLEDEKVKAKKLLEYKAMSELVNNEPVLKVDQMKVDHIKNGLPVDFSAKT